MYFLPEDHDKLVKLVRDGGYTPIQIVGELSSILQEYGDDLSDMGLKEAANKFVKVANSLYEVIEDYND